MATYTKNYVLIYSTQAVSMLLGMLSLFVVMPHLSSNQEVYGIYAICSSLTVFFSYADIGFVTSGQKFAAEAYIKKDKETELDILGFTSLILLVFLLVISMVIVYLSTNPSVLISDISDNNIGIASSLLVILACSSPIFCFQRICQMIYAVRLSDYYFQMIQILGNVLKIISVFYFFGGGRYDIVGYYFTFQIISALALIIAFIFAKIKFGVSYWGIIKHINFKRSVYDMLSGLAYATLFGSVCWILYYELDNMVIAKLLGASAVAIYAAAFSILSYLRNFLNILYSPFMARFNYFTAQNDIRGLNTFLKSVIEFFFPITIIPILSMIILSGPFVSSWVGPEYGQSAEVLSVLLIGIVLTFISTPSGIYITSRQKNRALYISNGLIVLIYWGGVFLTYKSLGVVSFAIMKSAGLLFSALFVFWVVFQLMEEKKLRFVFQFIYKYGIPLLCCAGIALLAKPYLDTTKGFSHVFKNVLFYILVCTISYLIFLPFSKLHRDKIKQFFQMAKVRIHK